MSFIVDRFSQEVVLVRIGKRLDFRNAPDFKTTCKRLAINGVRHFILDFSETGILDSTGLGSLLALYRMLPKETNPVVFASPSPPVQEIVQLTRTYRVFPQFHTVDEACRALSSPKALP